MYNYKTQKEKIFTEQGLKDFLKVRDGVLQTLKKSGAITMGSAIAFAGGGSSWYMMALVDHMVAVGDIVEFNYGECAGQDRVFRRKY